MASPSEEQKYAVFAPASVQAYAKSVGLYNLPEDVMNSLAEDASYRVREVISKSCEFMRFSRRRKLKSSDVDRALHWSNVPPIHGSNDSLAFTSGDGLYYVNDSNTDLKVLALECSQTQQYSQIALSKKWMLHDHPLLAKCEKTENEDPQSSDEDLSFEGYYSSLVESILSDDDRLFQLMLRDLRTNPKIGPLVSYVITFLSSANLVSHDLSKLSCMLFVVKAFLNNESVSVELYLRPLLKSVMYCVLEPLAASINPLNDHWIVRDCGALIAAQLVYSYPCETDSLLQHIYSSIDDILSDSTRPLCSHYGAVVLTCKLGAAAVQKLLIPNLIKYITRFLQPIMEDYSVDNINMKEDAQKVFGACLLAVLMLHFKVDSDRPGLKKTYPGIDASVYDMFGDALAVRLPLSSSETVQQPDSSSSKNADTSIPWHHYTLSSGFSRFALPLRKKWAVSEVFPSVTLKRNRPIQIGYGNARPIRQSRLQHPPNDQHSSSSHSLQLARRVVRIQKPFGNSSLMSWL